jgi:alanine racemase
VDLDAITANLHAVRAQVGLGPRVMAVVKADGYGHGAVRVARQAIEAGAAWLGVATLEEGLELRRAGIDAPVLVLGSVAADDVGEAMRHDLGLTIASSDALSAFPRARRRVRLHLKIDTGMTRLGVTVDEVPSVLNRLTRAGLRLEGVYTHLASADEPDHAFTREQLNRFDAVLPQVRAQFPQVIVHAANSAAALGHPRSRYDLVRVGLAMYGLYPERRIASQVTLIPAMRLLSRVVRTVRVNPGTTVGYGATYRTLRPTTIATVACGYADGYPRLAGLNGEVLLNGARVHIAGRVSMDHLTIDAGDQPVHAGDMVELFGRGLSVDEVAEWAHTISYEVVCGVGSRVPRVYFRRGRPIAVLRT